MATAQRKARYIKSDRKQLQAVLRDKGFRSTEGRLRLLSILRAAQRPLAIKEVARHPSNDLDDANLYRALEALSRSGILLRSDLRQRGVLYEYSHSHHHHLTCGTCGHSEDVGLCAGVDLERQVLALSRGFASVKTHSLEFFGLCAGCARTRV